MMTSLWNDLRYALRQLRKSPGFALTAILILALGIGANAAMFAVLNAVLLQPLPYAHANRLVVPKLFDARGRAMFGSMYPDIREWQQRAHTVSDIAYLTNRWQFFETARGGENASDIETSANLFSMLGVQPQIGRTYGLEEQTPGRDHVVVLNDALWDKYFHRDPDAIGRTIQMDGEIYTVIGVMPKAFSYPFLPAETSSAKPQVWTPLALTAEMTTRSGPVVGYYQVIARLRPGISAGAAQTELNHLQHAIAKEYPATYGFSIPVSVQVESYRASLTAEFRQPLLILEAACLMLWLIACANVVGLLLVRGSARQKQIAVRAALGAGRTRLLWQSLSESLLISLAAGGVGIGLAIVALNVSRRALSQRVPMAGAIHLNWPVLLTLAAFSIVTAVACGILPALLAVRVPAVQALQHGAVQISAGRRQKHLRDGLMVIEIALSLTLLIACGLLLRTVYALRHEPLGIRTDHVLTADFNLPTYRYHNANVVTALYQPLLRRTQHLADVEAASLSTTVPLDGGFFIQLSLYRSGKKSSDTQDNLILAQLGAATADLQRVFGFRMLQGRFFNAQDTYTSQPVVVINQALAKEWFPDGHVLGKKFMNWREGKQLSGIVIGVMDDLPQRSLAMQRGPQALVCISQLAPGDRFYQPAASVHMQLAVRTREQPGAVMPEIRGLLAQLAPQLRGVKIETMDQVVTDSMGDQNLAAHLLELFGGTALLITLAGLYGSLLYGVSLRRREMAIRLALGAQRRDIMALILSRAAWLLLAGLGAGIALSYATGEFLRSYLYKVHAHDWLTALAACLLFALCGLSAAYLPARRAASVDPMQALRTE